MPPQPEKGRPVLSAIVLCEEGAHHSVKRGADPAELLVRTLGSLVAVNVEGLLRDVVIAGPEGQELGLIADHAGCGLVEAETEALWLRLALEAVRGPDLLLLRSGHAPDAGFVEEARDFLRGGGTAARLRAVPERFLERLFPDLAPLAGLIAPRDLCLGAPSGRFLTLARHLGAVDALRTFARRVG